jgi:DNA-binding response OmpR family regulator
LVEDDPGLALAVSQCLRASGYEALWVEDGQQAVSEVTQRQIAMVLLDWRLQCQLQGSGLVHKLRAAVSRRLPVVVISADSAALTEASQAGVEDYLPKPFLLSDLVAVVDEYCQ